MTATWVMVDDQRPLRFLSSLLDTSNSDPTRTPIRDTHTSSPPSPDLTCPLSPMALADGPVRWSSQLCKRVQSRSTGPSQPTGYHTSPFPNSSFLKSVPEPERLVPC